MKHLLILKRPRSKTAVKFDTSNSDQTKNKFSFGETAMIAIVAPLSSHNWYAFSCTFRMIAQKWFNFSCCHLLVCFFFSNTISEENSVQPTTKKNFCQL